MLTRNVPINDVFNFIKENGTIPVQDTRRSQKEINKALIEVEEKVWYDRRRKAMEQAKSTGISVEYNGETGEEDTELEIEEKYPASELGPYSDFERGFLTGKLAALRWVLGCE